VLGLLIVEKRDLLLVEVPKVASMHPEESAVFAGRYVILAEDAAN
jgi:hypothetical protein